MNPLISGILLEKSVQSSGKVLSREKVREARKTFYEYAGPDARLGVLTLQPKKKC